MASVVLAFEIKGFGSDNSTSDPTCMVGYSSALRRVAVKLNKICNDLRLLGIAPHVSQELLCADIESIAAEKLFEVRSYECYLAKTEQIPNLMKEIAISREETFRAVGEGTGKAMDTDEYDTYYRHLILWDKVNKAFVGAYRLGVGWEIVDKYGLKGFYGNIFEYFIKYCYRAFCRTCNDKSYQAVWTSRGYGLSYSRCDYRSILSWCPW